MSASTTRVGALARKEIREYRRTGTIVATMAFLPLGIVGFPLIEVIALPASDANVLLNGDPLVILLGIPAILPAVLAGYAVVGEREQGTLEPVLTTPIRREELLLAKALAALVPTLDSRVRGVRALPHCYKAPRPAGRGSGGPPGAGRARSGPVHAAPRHVLDLGRPRDFHAPE